MASEWTRGSQLADGGWIFPDAPMTADVQRWEHREIDGVMECRAIYREDPRPC